LRRQCTRFGEVQHVKMLPDKGGALLLLSRLLRLPGREPAGRARKVPVPSTASQILVHRCMRLSFKFRLRTVICVLDATHLSEYMQFVCVDTERGM
jgi:hypothetical protein